MKYRGDNTGRMERAADAVKPPAQGKKRARPAGGEGGAARRSEDGGRFIPNLEQLREAVRGLPDPETWNEDRCTVMVTVGDRRQPVAFTRRRIRRGSGRPHRWVYEGKVLVRKQDM